MSTEGAGAYGAGKAGAPFDPMAFIKKPSVILRTVSTIWAIIVFGCIIAEGWHGQHCQMHDDPNACGYGTGIGILAFLICIAFLIVDAMFDNISSVQYRKYVVIADISLSDNAIYRAKNGYGRDHIQAAIAFSFFSILTWGGLTFFAVRRYREGGQDAFQSGYEPNQNVSSPYSSFPGSDTGDPYQQPPFSGQKEAPDYQQPTY
ncbi:hypothetical protein KUTeg_004023 [Tegillarca granosa]|uniref:MARVEL domain-containing protein n=1 Tax=Tegillarca granosa TaxID=220873 RepID=A0ABQ9FQL7_TEGGR|nr:hypothetical protein KUTeg_004023 [Tegillarca granosa]